MKKFNKTTFLVLAMVAALVAASNADAISYGTNITIPDGERTTQGYTSPFEDNETEPGMVQSQVWDLEGVFLKGNILTMIGGFDFKNGVKDYRGISGQKDFTSGDIFISTDKTYGRPLDSTVIKTVNSSGIATSTTYNPLTSADGSVNVNNRFGYEYALDINWADLSYSVVKLGTSASTSTVYYHQNEDGTPSSNPWKYFKGGSNIGAGVGTGGGLTEAEANTLGIKGWNKDFNHYFVSFDLSSVFSDSKLYGKEFFTHFTMGCGNDNLMGKGTVPVPEPGTFLLLGAGLLGLVGYRKKLRR